MAAKRVTPCSQAPLYCCSSKEGCRELCCLQQYHLVTNLLASCLEKSICVARQSQYGETLAACKRSFFLWTGLHA